MFYLNSFKAFLILFSLAICLQTNGKLTHTHTQNKRHILVLLFYEILKNQLKLNSINRGANCVWKLICHFICKTNHHTQHTETHSGCQSIQWHTMGTFGPSTDSVGITSNITRHHGLKIDYLSAPLFVQMIKVYEAQQSVFCQLKQPHHHHSFQPNSGFFFWRESNVDVLVQSLSIILMH